MQNIDADTEKIISQPHSGSAKDWRALSDLLSIWALCGRSACRKARACRGDSRKCIPRCGPLVPEDVRVWMAALMEYKRDGLRFDDARAALPPELEEAWAAWDEAVKRIARKKAAKAVTDPSLVIPDGARHRSRTQTSHNAGGSRLSPLARPG